MGSTGPVNQLLRAQHLTDLVSSYSSNHNMNRNVVKLTSSNLSFPRYLNHCQERITRHFHNKVFLGVGVCCSSYIELWNCFHTVTDQFIFHQTWHHKSTIHYTLYVYLKTLVYIFMHEILNWLKLNAWSMAKTNKTNGGISIPWPIPIMLAQ